MASRSRDWKLYGWKETLPRRVPILLTKGTAKHCRTEAETYRRGGWYVGYYLETPSEICLTGTDAAILLGVGAKN